MIRRIAAALAFALCFFALSPPVWAGSYLHRAAMLLDESRKEGDLLQPRVTDKELIRLIKALAEVRVTAGRSMEIPAVVAKAHPHLLLVLENSERAADAAQEGNFKKFMQHLQTARDEDRTFRAILAELGFKLPDVATSR
jgi:hypothetical protein